MLWVGFCNLNFPLEPHMLQWYIYIYILEVSCMLYKCVIVFSRFFCLPVWNACKEAINAMSWHKDIYVFIRPVLKNIDVFIV